MEDPRPARRFSPGIHGVFARRVPGPIGCLVALILVPIVLALGIVMFVVALLPFGRRRRAAIAGARAPQSGAREEALRRLVSVFAGDESFSADEARQAGTLASGGATVDDLLEDALERRWIEVRGERLAVTPRGREATDRSLP